MVRLLFRLALNFLENILHFVRQINAAKELRSRFQGVREPPLQSPPLDFPVVSRQQDGGNLVTLEFGGPRVMLVLEQARGVETLLDPRFVVPENLLDLPGDQVSMINAMGNPFIWWFGLAAVLIALIMVIKDRHLHFMYLVVIYFFQLLPFAFLSRDTYIYYYYPEVPILVLLIAGILNDFWREPEIRKYIILYLVVVTISFVAFYPVISGYPAPSWYFRSLKWFQAWDFLGVA